MSNTYVCTDCDSNCRLTLENRNAPEQCVYDDTEVYWRIESPDETRAREQAAIIKHVEFDRPQRKA